MTESIESCATLGNIGFFFLPRILFLFTVGFTFLKHMDVNRLSAMYFLSKQSNRQPNGETLFKPLEFENAGLTFKRGRRTF